MEKPDGPAFTLQRFNWAPLFEGAYLVYRTATTFNQDRCTFLAAGLCYFVFFSIFPLLLLLIAILSFFITGDEALSQTMQMISGIFPNQAGFLEDLLRDLINHRGSASLFGLVTLLWSAKNIFSSLAQALNIIWGVQRDRGVIKETSLAVGLSLSLGLLLLISGVSFAILTAILNFRVPFLGLAPNQVPGIVFLIANILPMTLLGLVLAGLYKVLPNRKLTWRQVLPGALIAATSWEIGRRGFSFYLEHMARFDKVYGSISGIVGFMLWIYISAILFLLGAEVNKTLCERRAWKNRISAQSQAER